MKKMENARRPRGSVTFGLVASQRGLFCLGRAPALRSEFPRGDGEGQGRGSTSKAERGQVVGGGPPLTC